MRAFGLAMAGAIALTASTTAQADPSGPKIWRAGAAAPPGVVQIWDGNRPQLRQWRGAWARD